LVIAAVAFLTRYLALMTDIDFGISATPIEEKHSIYVTSEKLSIRHHNFENVRLYDFIRNLINANLKMREPIHLKRHGSQDFFSIDIGKKITVQHLFNKLFITADTIVIADVGDCLFGALD
jgi:TPP-dependent 2-oxoacid decarboxylase